MRFGRYLHSHVIPEWANTYIDYERFKVLLKRKSEYSRQYSSLAEDIAVAAAGADSFYLLQLDRMCIKTDQVFASAKSKGLEMVSALIECLEMHSELIKLRWFGLVNKESVDRLHSKIGKPKSSLGTGLLESIKYIEQTRCTNLIQQVSDAISTFEFSTIQRNVLEASLDSPPPHLGLLFLIKLYGRLPLLSAWETTVKSNHDDTEVADRLELQLSASLHFLLLGPSEAIWSKDRFGCLPLHYAAQYGLVDICVILLRHMERKPLPDLKNLLEDAQGHTPLQRAVVGSHTAVVEALLASSILKPRVPMTNRTQALLSMGDLVMLAIRLDAPKIVALLLHHDADINVRNAFDETAIYVAAKSGSIACVEAALHTLDPGLDVSNGPRELTPLMAATIRGHTEVAELLIAAGADMNITDAFGWAATDHAAYRGHLRLAKLLAASAQPKLRKHANVSIASSRSPSAVALSHEIYVNLGPLNTRSEQKPVDLDSYRLNLPTSTHPDTRFAIEIRAIGSSGHTYRLDLPLLEDRTNFPLKFTIGSEDPATIVFKILHSTAKGQIKRVHVGSACALLDSLKKNVGSDRESLIRDYAIPILEKGTLYPIGSVTFNFLIVKPFPKLEVAGNLDTDLFSYGNPIPIIGHRGFGANSPATKRFQVGENTILASQVATSLGASFIEFDVQLTSDLIPIVYHDNIVTETGIDVPPWAVSLSQFKFISREQKRQDDTLLTSYRSGLTRADTMRKRTKSIGSFDIGGYDGERMTMLTQRMEQTVDYRRTGFKANVRGASIADAFATLEEFLKTAPEQTGFDIELKYPMLWEAEDAKMELYGIELNRYIDTILETVLTYAGNRKIFFSSFFPELCILCSRKQQKYPVLFLNDGGNTPTGDIRASNTQEALKFAKAWNLAGIVVASEPLVFSPKIIGHVKEQGLKCLSYGALNNTPEKAKIQIDAGLDAMCVDDVGLIMNALRASQPKSIHTDETARKIPQIEERASAWVNLACPKKNNH